MFTDELEHSTKNIEKVNNCDAQQLLDNIQV